MREKKPTTATTDVKSPEEQIKELKDKVADLQKKVSILEADNGKLIDENKKLTDDNKALAKAVPGLQTDLNQANDKINTAESQRDEAIRLLSLANTRIDELKKQNDSGVVIDASFEDSFIGILKDMQKQSNEVFKNGLNQLKEAKAVAQARAEANVKAEAEKAEADEQQATVAEIIKLARKLKK